MKFILGKKIEMRQKFQDEKVMPITIIQAGPCIITQIRTKDKDKLQAVQIGFEELKAKKVKKPQKNTPFRYLRQFSACARGPSASGGKGGSASGGNSDDISNCKVGDKIDVAIFKPGDKLIISGISKGKGFAGVMKRHGFHGMPATHGTKHDHRHAGSIGATAPQRVLKGKKMAGRMGGERVTVKNLEVIEVNPEKNLLVVKGAVPGARNSLLEIRSRE